VLSLPDHPHHERALAYWREEADPELAFCRMTMLGLLRLLTHPKVTGGALPPRPWGRQGRTDWHSIAFRRSSAGAMGAGGQGPRP